MFNKGDTLNQTGNNNVAIQNSEVVINISAHDRLAQLGAIRDYEGVIKLMKELKDHANTLHPYYPHYKYRTTEVGSRIFVDHEPLSVSSSKSHPLTYRGKFKISKNEGLIDQRIDELIYEAYLNQENVEIDMFSLEAFIGDSPVPTPFLEENVKDGVWYITPDPLPDSVRVKIVLGNGEEEVTLIDYLELNISGYDRGLELITLSNNQQKESEISVSLFIQKKSQGFLKGSDTFIDNINFDFSIKEGFTSNVKANLQLMEIMKILSENPSFTVSFKNISTGKVFLSAEQAHLKNILDENFEREFQLLLRLRKIEEYFGFNFELPSEIGVEDYNSLEILESIMNGKPIIKHYSSVTINVNLKSTLKKLIKIFDVENLKSYSFSGEYTGSTHKISLFGESTIINKIKVTYQSTIPEDLSKVKRKYDIMEDGEVINFKLLPAVNNHFEEEYFLE